MRCSPRCTSRFGLRRTGTRCWWTVWSCRSVNATGWKGVFSDKKGYCGQNVQVVATLSGRVADVGDPCPGAMHDSRAFRESGIAERWATHYQPGGPGMTGDKGYQGSGINTAYKKPPGRELTDARRAC